MSADHLIRPYVPSDKAIVMALFCENVPRFFAESEIADLDLYLDKEIEDYFVIETDGQIAGAGGINYEDETGIISWDFLRPSQHGRGLGSALLQYRLSILRRNPGVKRVIVRTSQLTYSFYGKNGFQTVEVEKDFWAEGYDLYLMELKEKSS